VRPISTKTDNGFYIYHDKCKIHFRVVTKMWLGLQADYELRLARYERIRQIETCFSGFKTAMKITY
jgi:hypothetical protein